MRCIIKGAAYDTETAERIKQVWWDDMEQQTTVLHRTRNGAFFFYYRYFTPSYDMKEELSPCTDQEAQEWLEKYATSLVEHYFGTMPEGGSAERRLTLRMPNNLAKRLENIAQAKDMSLNRYINKCLEHCASDDGKPAIVV